MALARVKVWSTAETLTASDLNSEFNNIINNASSLISPLSGSLDWDGYAHTLDAAGVTSAQSTSSVAWTFIPGNKSGTPSTTGGISNWAASTWTDSATAASGTAAAWVGHAFKQPTLAASNATVTTTDAATVYIANAPSAGSNETLTNAWGLWVDAGNVRFDDNIAFLSGTAFKGILDHANSADRTYSFADATGTVPVVAAQSDVNAMTSTIMALSPNHNKLVLATEQATTSGTNIDFTGIPAGVRRIIIQFAGVSTNGTNLLLVQVGDSGGAESSGYLGSGVTIQDSAAISGAAETAGLVIRSNSAANVLHGSVVLTLEDSANFTWVGEAAISASNGGLLYVSSSSKSLSAELDRVRITTSGGTDTFDAGAINVIYER